MRPRIEIFFNTAALLHMPDHIKSLLAPFTVVSPKPFHTNHQHLFSPPFFCYSLFPFYFFFFPQKAFDFHSSVLFKVASTILLVCPFAPLLVCFVNLARKKKLVAVIPFYLFYSISMTQTQTTLLIQ